MKKMKEGDNVSDQYQRDGLAIKDWDRRHLQAPEKNEQWVEIQDKYVLVDIPTETIKQMIKNLRCPSDIRTAKLQDWYEMILTEPL